MTVPDAAGFVVVGGFGFVLFVLAWMWTGWGIHTIRERRRCKLAPHDYHVKNGGDGIPTHFYTYTCWNCGEEFSI